MTCKSPLRQDILDALITEAQGKIIKARTNVEIYLHNPVGIGEHPDVLSAVQDQLDVMAHEQERIDMIEGYFTNTTE